jgi:lipoprotein-anchoring transpeptidase ErfK/SrfK
VKTGAVSGATVRRGATFVALSGCAVAGVAAAFLVAGPPVAGADGGTTVTSATTTEPPPPTTTTAPPPAPPPPQKLISAGITVGGTLVGGLSAGEAADVLRAAFAKPLKLVVSPTRTISVEPKELGASAYVGDAVKRALTYHRAGINVPLSVRVATTNVERYAEQLGRDLDRAPVDSRWVLRNLRPFPTESKDGRRLNRVLASRGIVGLLRRNDRDPLQLPFRTLQPKTSPGTIGHAIVIRRGENRLYLYRGDRFVRRFQVATGQSIYPTPLGHFAVVIKERNPWWYPPVGSAWAAGEKPVPPGPGNPLGTRWMGLSAPNVGIHGTPDAASIGYSASHGCIRMRIPEAEWLFDHVEVGTQVFIVAT